MTPRAQSFAVYATVGAATLLAVLPWGLAADYRLLPPLLPFLVIHYWTMRRVELVPEALVFAAGLGLDILSGGPMGYWALIYLFGYALTLAASAAPNVTHPAARWLLLALTLGAVASGEVVLAALYFNAAADWSPPLFAAFVATLLYPLVAFLLRALARSDGQSANAARGGPA